VAWEPDGPSLAVRLAVGVFGSTGTSAAEAEGLVPRFESVLRGGGLFDVRPIDPATVVPAAADVSRGIGHGQTQTSQSPDGLAGGGMAHGPGQGRFDGYAAHLVQGTWSIGDENELIEVVSRFSPTMEPWTGVVTQLARWPRAVRVRATVLATQMSPSDRLDLESGLARVRALRARNPERAEIVFDADRAEATLLDLRASFGSPLLVGELAVSSPDLLPDSLLRSLAATFTSQSDVRRQQMGVVVAGSRLVLGGFDIVRDPPGWQEAHRHGIPLRGGLGPRAIRDLLTLSESPIGLPLPIGDGLPTLTTRVHLTRTVANVLRPGDGVEATVIGTGDDGAIVAVPLHFRTRSLLVTGTWGAGKSSLLFGHALADLRANRPFLFVDPHGTTALELVAFARLLGRDPVVVDPLDAGSDRLCPLPAFAPDGANRVTVEAASRRMAEAVASSLINPEWAGPRFFAAFEALMELLAAHGGELIDAATWLNDPVMLQRRVTHSLLSPLARSTLANLCASTGDGADVRGWVASKLHPLLSAVVRRVVAPAGHGVDLAAALADRRPVIIGLAGLSVSEAALVGHLGLGTVLDAAFARADPDPDLVTCYVDEAHRFPARGLSRVVAEGRKFGVGLVAATQALGQLPPDVADLLLGAGVHAAFRTTPDTAARLAGVLGVDARELLALPDLHAVVMVQGSPATTVVVPPIERCPVPAVRQPPGDAGLGTCTPAPDGKRRGTARGTATRTRREPAPSDSIDDLIDRHPQLQTQQAVER